MRFYSSEKLFVRFSGLGFLFPPTFEFYHSFCMGATPDAVWYPWPSFGMKDLDYFASLFFSLI